MTKRNLIQIIICFLLLVLSAGCWDQVNIEENGFVIGTAVDLSNNDSDGNINISLTNQIVSPDELGTPTNEGSENPPFINLTTTGDSIFEINRKMLKEISRVPFYGHSRLVIVSEKLAHNPELFASMLDVFIRDQEMRRGIKIIIAEGEAKNILDIDPKPEKLPVMHIDMITDNSYKSIEIIEPVTLGRLHDYLLHKNSYVLPKISINNDGIDYSGAAVFDGTNDKMVGTLNGLETKGMNLIKGDTKEGMIKFKVNNHIMAFDLERAKKRIDIKVEDPKNMEIFITIKAEGKLAEMYGSKTLSNPSYIKEMEDKISKKIEQLADLTIDKAQKELKLDILDIDKTLKEKHYGTWRKIHKDWENKKNYFSNSRIHVSADVKVREVGSTDRVKEKEHE
ncbi:Ger(x)C family spore germination protein [Virgibacillus sp. MSJ-26]|uniref:Ger(x)C family spore germination protein n=1 Tax=Virgibacillus sp. MSJ-26 TaxID=2841522 RepID=UPI001C113DB2|nr:Ger(x)C family spore germination protein [Virgibacillus sp. MSJ-26]